MNIMKCMSRNLHKIFLLTGILLFSLTVFVFAEDQTEMIIPEREYLTGRDSATVIQVADSQSAMVEAACDTVVLAGMEETNPTYASSYGYASFEKTENGAGKQQLYRAIDMAAEAFHSDTSLDVEGGKAIISADYTTYGLTAEQAIEVWNIYRLDHPLYYWISNTVRYNDNEIYLTTDEEYAQGAERERYNELISSAIETYRGQVEGETSAYRIALAYHDSIINAIDYAFKADGTPEDAAWAHNILGVFEKGAGVCESYAKTFQLLLNSSGIENIIVTGIGNEEAHAWNLVQLDDENWYWFDLTWDDTPEFGWGISYQYFCVNDTVNVNWTDGLTREECVGPLKTFLEDHEPNLPSDTGADYLYELPARSVDRYESQGELLLREMFVANDKTYAVVGYNTAAIVGFGCPDYFVEFRFPETVTYRGMVYTVIAAGPMNLDGVFYYDESGQYGPFVYAENATVHIPKTLIHIYDSVVINANVKAFEVDPDNPVFCSCIAARFCSASCSVKASLSGLLPFFNSKCTRYSILPSGPFIGENSKAFTKNPKLSA